MLKKLVITTAVLAVSSTLAHAAGAPYVGVGVGVNNTSSGLKLTNGTTVNSLSSRGAVLDLFGGYGVVVNQNIYLGGELFLNANSTQAKGSGPTGSFTRVNNKNSYGISFMPGLMVSEHTMVYARGGFVRATFNAANSTGGSYTSKNATVNGAQVGMGIQTNLAQNIDLRGEYVYSSYRSFNVGGAKVSPKSDQFNLGVVYKFD